MQSGASVASHRVRLASAVDCSRVGREQFAFRCAYVDEVRWSARSCRLFLVFATAVTASSCSSATSNPRPTATTHLIGEASEPIQPNPALSTSPALTTPPATPTSGEPVIHPSPDTPGSLNDGCIDVRGEKIGGPTDWYRDDANGVVVLDIGELHDDSSAAAPLADILASVSSDGGDINTWEFVSPDEPSCVVGRGAAIVRHDGSQLRLSIWRLTDAVRTSSIPQHSPFTPMPPDLLVSNSISDGDITALKVLADGTTIKVVALGVDALGFAGWPTTTAPRPGQSPQHPLQSVSDVAAIAAMVADTIERQTLPSDADPDGKPS